MARDRFELHRPYVVLQGRCVQKISSASGPLDNFDTSVKGTLQQKISSASGPLDNDDENFDTSVMGTTQQKIPSASGPLDNDAEISDISVQGTTLQKNSYASGPLRAHLDAVWSRCASATRRWSFRHLPMRELDSFTCHLGEHWTEPLSVDHKEQLTNPELGKPVLMMRTLTSIVPFRVARSDISGKPFYLVEQPDGTCTYLSRCELGLPYQHCSMKELPWFYRDVQGTVQGPIHHEPNVSVA